MTDTLDRLKATLADRYAIERERHGDGASRRKLPHSLLWFLVDA